MKYNLFFKLSFIIYTLALFASPYVSARIGADIVILFFIAAVVYQLIYLFHLRKKDNLTFTRVLAQYFFYALLSLELWAILCCINSAINGYTPSDILGNAIGEKVYGWDAITGDGIGFYFYKIVILTATIYQIVYALVLNTLKKRKIV